MKDEDELLINSLASAPVAVNHSMYGPAGVTCNFGPTHLTAKFLLHVLPVITHNIDILLSLITWKDSSQFSVICRFIFGSLPHFTRQHFNKGWPQVHCRSHRTMDGGDGSRVLSAVCGKYCADYVVVSCT
jgi:hypothetical protein